MKKQEIQRHIHLIDTHLVEMSACLVRDMEVIAQIIQVFQRKTKKAQRQLSPAKIALVQQCFDAQLHIVGSLQDIIDEIHTVKNINRLLAKELSPKQNQDSALNYSSISYSHYLGEIANLCVAQLKHIKKKYKAKLDQIQSVLSPIRNDREIINTLHFFILSSTQEYQNFQNWHTKTNLLYGELAFVAPERNYDENDFWNLRVILRLILNRLNCKEQRGIIQELFPHWKLDTLSIES